MLFASTALDHGGRDMLDHYQLWAALLLDRDDETLADPIPLTADDKTCVLAMLAMMLAAVVASFGLARAVGAG